MFAFIRSFLRHTELFVSARIQAWHRRYEKNTGCADWPDEAMSEKEERLTGFMTAPPLYVCPWSPRDSSLTQYRPILWMGKLRHRLIK